MKRLLSEENKKRNLLMQNVCQSSSRFRFIVIGLIFFLAVLSAEIWIVNRLSTYGDKIFQLKQAEASLELENQVMANSIAEHSSLAALEQKANQLGFNNINQIEYIKFQDKLASAK